MSLEAFYQCVPAHCQVLKRSIADEEYGQFLVSKYRFKAEQPHPMWEGQDAEFCQDMNAMLKAHPGLHARNLSLGTSWDILEYYISPARRSENFAQPDLGRKAINGENELAPHLFCSQGVPLRLTPPETVKKILTYLMQTNFKANFDLDKMRQAQVYKNSEDWKPETFGPFIQGLLDQLTAFYRQASISNEGVLVWVD
ncbi:DUF1877 family protein [bacterium]|nr:DUF1877 family protein [bacterium]